MPEKTAIVNVSCANVYHEATFHTETDTQVLLWEKVIILDEVKNFFRIESEDHYQGWVNRHQLAFQSPDNFKNKIKITSPIISFYEEPDTKARVIRDGCAGTSIPQISEKDGWYETILPDGKKSWVEKGNFKDFGLLSRKNFIEYGQRFLGIPYYWGGKTAKGFDCSGLTQFVHGMFGINLRRDSWMQYEDGVFISENPLEGNPGDLMFFAEDGSRITHVGICLNNGGILHARGMVKINSLSRSGPDFDESLLKNFVGIKTFIKDVS
jgi:cell wall-associated NlpC family hydrolase